MPYFISVYMIPYKIKDYNSYLLTCMQLILAHIKNAIIYKAVLDK
ncbi:hypothetical protein DFQ10_110136 [Winogradskyella eximia]|uniref:Uncharacterized protein n=1 Tax=Winogradskyella eximia TaxID=262006 RepID=A0A3D9GQJ5_9FLAO|nr:hypothetical protein DFQ10_110136 [Winogradskyella eximia]